MYINSNSKKYNFEDRPLVEEGSNKMRKRY